MDGEGGAVRSIFLISGVVALFAVPVHAQDAAKVCSAIEDSLQRLTCFDKLFPRETSSAEAEKSPNGATSGVTKAEEEPSGSGSISPWQITEEKSPLDDSVVYTAYLTAKTASTTGIGKGEAFLILRCAENTTSALFSTSLFMMSERPQVTIRLGDAKAETTSWTRSTSYKAAGLWSGAQAIPFLKSLPDNTRLVLRISDNDRLDAEFDLADVSKPIAKIREHCKW